MKAGNSINVNQLSKEIAKMLTLYTEEVSRGVEIAVEDVSTEALSDVRKNSPKKTGKYSNGWRKKRQSYKAGKYLNNVIFNQTSYRITHLLENGYQRNGYRVSGKPHLAPAEAKAISSLENKIEEVIKNASK